ncbi:hypothetical protein NE865_00360 [Phthorimaea operculella]|nr:hypothetical protein NE865_00360 [Phthorimaea operculella]
MGCKGFGKLSILTPDITATRKSDGATHKFRVQEGTAEDKTQVMEFMAKYMIPTESFHRASRIALNKEALEEMVRVYETFYDHNHIMICYEDNESNDNPIVGISTVDLEEGDKELEFSDFISKLKTPEVKKMFQIIQVAEGLCSVKKSLGINKYYGGRGVCIRPEFAGFGVATELFKLRRQLCEERGVPATTAWMTAVGSQKAAEKDGWKTLFEISFADLGRLADCEFVKTPPTCKLMVGFPDNK